MELNKEEKTVAETKEEESIDLSKVTPISKEEEIKLNAFLNKFTADIKGDEELEGIFGNTINQWSQEIEAKHNPKV
jgi:hypothetical protein